MQDGYIFGHAARKPGEAYLKPGKAPLSGSSGAATSDPAWSGLESVTLASFQNQFRWPNSPRVAAPSAPRLSSWRMAASCLVQGTGHIVACVDSHRLVACALHKQTIKPIKPKDRWVTLNLNRYVGHRLHLKFIPAPKGQLSVRMVTQGLDKTGIAETEKELAASEKPFETFAQSAGRILGSAKEKAPRSVANGTYGARQTNPAQVTCRPGHDGRKLGRRLRSNPRELLQPGKVAPRKFLTAVTGDTPMDIPSGSGRLELVAQINDPANPLTSRVIVNCIWHHLLDGGLSRQSTTSVSLVSDRPI